MKKGKYEGTVIVPDLDGTLINSAGKLRNDVIEAFARLNVNIAPEEVVGNWYSLTEKYGISRDKFDQSFDKRKTWKESLERGEISIFPETREFLEYLQKNGARLGLLTKSIPEYTDQKIDYFDLRKYFETVQTVHPREKSKLGGAIEIVRNLNPETIQEAYFIGDKEEDISVSKKIGRIYKINARGIYVNREGNTLNGYTNVNSLNKIVEVI